MPDFDVQQVLEAAARAIYDIGRDPAVSFDDAKSGDLGDATGLYRMAAASSEHDARAALAVILPAVTQQIRALAEKWAADSADPFNTPFEAAALRVCGYELRELADALDAAVRGEQP